MTSPAGHDRRRGWFDQKDNEMMSTKCSHVFLAVLALSTAPAFAQEAAAPAADAGAMAKELDATAKEAVDAAAEAVKKIADEAVTDATTTTPAEAMTETAAEPMAKPTTEGETTMAPAETPAAESEPAQSTTEPAASTPPAPKAEAPEAAAPAAAEPAASSEDPAVGQPYVKSEHSDWTINCVKLEQGEDPCVLTQLLRDESNSPVAEMSFVSLSGQDVAAGGTLVTPLETDLIRGVGIRVDEGETRGYPFNVCTAQDGCIARIGFTAQELQQFKRGGKAVVSLLPYGADPKNPVNLPMSLSGFTAGFEELTKLTKAAEEAAKQ